MKILGIFMIHWQNNTKVVIKEAESRAWAIIQDCFLYFYSKTNYVKEIKEMFKPFLLFLNNFENMFPDSLVESHQSVDGFLSADKLTLDYKLAPLQVCNPNPLIWILFGSLPLHQNTYHLHKPKLLGFLKNIVFGCLWKFLYK